VKLRSRHGLRVRLLFIFLTSIGERKDVTMMVGSVGLILDRVEKEFKLGLIRFMAQGMKSPFLVLGV